MRSKYGMLARMNFIRWIVMAAALLGGAAQAQFDFGFGSMAGASAPATFSIAADASVTSYKIGEPFYIALKGNIAEPWHAYFRNPATVGEAVTASLQAPDGFKIEGPYWQPPVREEGMIGVSYAYEGNAPLVVWKLTPEVSAPERAEFSLSGTAQTCNDEGCNPPDTKSTVISLSRGDGAANAQWQDKQKQVEILGDAPGTVSAEQTSEAVQLHFTVPGEVTEAYFFSDDNSINPSAKQPLAKTENGYTLTLPRNDGKDMMYPAKDPDSVGKELETLSGILTFNGGFRAVNIPLKAQAAPAQAQEDASGIPAGILGIIGSLFLGGLILNLMPCVFPVIGLKIMSFVELGGGDRRKVFLHSLAFVLGILISFWVLAIALVVASNMETLANTPWTEWAETLWNDAGSESRSWAAWMQNEWIVYAILLLLIALGLSMFGLFEIGVGATGAGQNLQNKKGLWGSFFQGLLVTVVATPCSAPFLGAALPAAMSLPGVWMVASLTFMALGLALPYIVLGAFPQLASLLPRPGAWMESLKQGLSFLLFAAAAWMLDVYLAFIPESQSANVMWILMSLVVFCAAFWVYGRWCPIYRSKQARISGFVIALALLALGVWGSMPALNSRQEATAPAAGSTYVVAQGAHPEWNTWSKAAMDQALADGHPVYVDFTAKWCATCQSNKQLAYSDEVYAEFARAGAVLMRADKTRHNEAIDAEMRRLNRSSVPVNALYMPRREPAITREVFTSGYLLDFLKEHLQNLPAPDGESGKAPENADGAE